MSHSSSVARSTRPVRIEVASCLLHGDLAVPSRALGLVVFAHASGTSRFTAGNRFIADALDRHDLATLLIDLLTEDEEAHDERTGRLRFDVNLLASRLGVIEAWAVGLSDLRPLRVGLFGSGTGAGAALLAAAQQPRAVHAV